MSGHCPADGYEGAFSCRAGWSVEHHWLNHVVVVAVRGEVDAFTAPQLTAAISTAVAGSSPGGVILDLTQVSFLASAGLSVLLATHDAVAPNARFGVVARGVAARPITVLGLGTVTTLYRTVADALGDFGGG